MIASPLSGLCLGRAHTAASVPYPKYSTPASLFQEKQGKNPPEENFLKNLKKHLTNPKMYAIIVNAFDRRQLNMRVWRNWQTRKIQVLMIARLCRFKSCHPHQKMVVIFCKITTIFIQTAGLAYHHALACISSALWAVYHHSPECISLRFDDIQCSALMIYRNKLRMIYKASP